jgi:hypothetical protein
MDALAASANRDLPALASPVAMRLARAGQLTACAVLALAAIVVCSRRAGGALGEPLPAPLLLAVGIALALSAISFRRLVAPHLAALRPVAGYAVWAAPTAAILLWAVGVLLVGTSLVGLTGFLAFVLAEEGWSWGRFGQQVAMPIPRAPRVTAPLVPAPPKQLLAETETAELEPAEPEMLPETDPLIVQQMTRRREEQGEVIEGWVRVEFQPQQRHAAAHVAICPPLARTPLCYAEPSDGLAAQVKVGQALPYGVRFEVKLDQPAEEAGTVTVEFSIQEQKVEG